MAQGAVRRNITLLEDIGDTPIHIALPILRSVERPEQLALLEERSPALVEHTTELWFNFIKRDVYEWKDILSEKRKRSGEPWTEDEAKQKTNYKIYKKWLARSEVLKAEAEEVLKERLAAVKNAAIKKETRIVEKLPQSWMKSRTSLRGGSSASAEIRFTSGSRTKTDTVRGLMTKVRREAADARLTRPGSTLGTPTHLLNTGKPRTIIARSVVAPPMRRLLSENPSLKPKSAAHAPESPERLKSPISSSNKISPRKAAEESKGVESTTKQGDPSQVSPYRPLKRKAATVLLPVKRMK
jgi:RNA polymerase II transcription factor SIII (elongin) subunit A